MKKITMVICIAMQTVFCFSSNKTNTNNDLVQIVSINPKIKLDIRYATTNNITGIILYASDRCYLRKSTALKLNNVQNELEKQGLGLKIFDGYRPRAIQYKLWDACPDKNYVADPKNGSRHNRGAAVDLTLIDTVTGEELEMPSGFDEMNERAHRTYETMTSLAAKNCKLLEDIMVKYGFIPLPTEWWHFDDEHWQEYDLLDIPTEQLKS